MIKDIPIITHELHSLVVAAAGGNSIILLTTCDPELLMQVHRSDGLWRSLGLMLYVACSRELFLKALLSGIT